MGLISNVTAFVSGPSGQNPGTAPLNVEDARTGEILTAKQTAAARDFINELACSRRAMAHGLLYVGRGNLDYIQYRIDNHHPDAWKGYNISNAAKVDSGPMKPWRHDDENVAYPTFELESRRTSAGGSWALGATSSPCTRVSPAARRPSRERLPVRPAQGADRLAPPELHHLPLVHPGHLLRRPGVRRDPGHRGRDPTAPQRRSQHRLGHAVRADDQPFKNSYAEIGTTFASSVVTFPTVTAHILGQLMRYKGQRHILFGSDSLWYGSPPSANRGALALRGCRKKSGRSTTTRSSTRTPSGTSWDATRRSSTASTPGQRGGLRAAADRLPQPHHR